MSKSCETCVHVDVCGTEPVRVHDDTDFCEYWRGDCSAVVEAAREWQAADGEWRGMDFAKCEWRARNRIALRLKQAEIDLRAALDALEVDRD